MKLHPILTAFIGEVSNGRLARLAFLWRFLLIILVFMTVAIGLGMTGGIASRAVLFLLFSAMLCFAMVNLLAKRIRHIGISGWIGVGVLMGTGILVAIALPGPVEFVYATATIAALGILPGRSKLQSPG